MKYTLTDLSATEVDLIALALAELPLKISGMLFAKVRDQVQEQQKPADLSQPLRVVPDGDQAA